MSKTAAYKRSKAIESMSTPVDRVAFEMFLLAERRSPITNQLWNFLSDPRLKKERAVYRALARLGLRGPVQATCIRCGCTEDRACSGGCSWIFLGGITQTWGFCSACLELCDDEATEKDA